MSKPVFYNKNESAFTIIELMVVLVLFATIMAATVSIFISIIQQQRRISKEQDLLNQTSYLIEYMSRGIRSAVKDKAGDCLGSSFTGYIYLLTRYDSVAGVYQGIKFISSDNSCQEFFLDTDGILKEKKDSNPAQKLLSDSFELKYARFIVNGDKIKQGASEGDFFQPRITILLDIKTKNEENPQEKIIQTTVSQRELNI